MQNPKQQQHRQQQNNNIFVGVLTIRVLDTQNRDTVHRFAFSVHYGI